LSAFGGNLMPRISFVLAVLTFSFLQCAPALAEKRVALVIGNAAYAHAGKLANPKNDATDMAANLKALGFEVILGTDLDKRALDGKIRDFARALETGDAGVFFYAGHGLQVAGQNYIIPIDAKLENERDLDFETVRLDFVLHQMELNREQKTNIVFLDACRDNPLARNLSRSMGTRSANIGHGLAQVDAGVGTFVAFSTQPGNVALDGAGRNSPFAAALTKRIKEPGRNLNAIMIDVRKDVLQTTAGKQVPWDHSALTGDFFFDLAAATTGLPKQAPAASSDDAQAMKDRIKKLEEELKRTADSTQTAELQRLKDQSQQIETQSREDWERIFDLRRNASGEGERSRRQQMETEANTLQMKISRRGQDRAKLNDKIGELEKKLGVAPNEAAGAEK
jgi:uncharacterized caspase-like protein